MALERSTSTAVGEIYDRCAAKGSRPAVFYRWKNKGNEDEHARSDWIELMSDILDVENVTKRLYFEKKVVGPDGNTFPRQKRWLE